MTQIEMFAETEEAKNVIVDLVARQLESTRPDPREVVFIASSVNPGDDVISISTQVSNIIQMRKVEDPASQTYKDQTVLITVLYKRLEEAIDYALKMPTAN